jgi:hypothetical protein
LSLVEWVALRSEFGHFDPAIHFSAENGRERKSSGHGFSRAIKEDFFRSSVARA